MGKTTLLDAAARRAGDRGFRVLRLSGARFETGMAFAALSQLLPALFHESGNELSPAHRTALDGAFGSEQAVSAERLLVATATLNLLRVSAGHQPLLLTVDDAQWLDRSSAEVLGLVARRIGSARARAGIVAAVQPGDPVFDTTDLDRIELRPLDEGAAGELLAGRFPFLIPRVRRRIIAEAAGNPLALLELPSALLGPQRLAVRSLPDILPLNDRLRTLFAAHVNRLSRRARGCLLMIALDGVDSSNATLPGVTTDDLDALAAAGFVEADPDTRRLVFRHPLIRSAVVELSDAADLRLAHQMLAHAYRRDPDRHAWHLAEAAIPWDEHVARLLDGCSARDLERGDPVGAVAALNGAAALSSPGADRARRLTHAAYLAATTTGDLRAVSQLLVDARGSDPSQRDCLEGAVAGATVLLNVEGDVDAAHQLLTNTLRRTIDRSPGIVVEQAFHCLILVCRFANREELWSSYFDSLSRFNRSSDDLRRESRLFGAPSALGSDDVASIEATIAGLADETDPSRIVRLGHGAFYLDRLALCRQRLLNVVRDGRDGGAVAPAIHAANLLAHEARLAGSWDDAEQLATEGIRLCRDHGYELLEWATTWHLAVLAANRGRRDEANRLTDQMSRWASPRGVMVVETYVRQARGIAALGDGDFEAAYRDFAALTSPGVLAAGGTVALWTTLDLIESAWRTGRTDEARSHAAVVEGACLGSLSSRLALIAEAAVAVVASDDEATTRFERALERGEAWRWPFDAARVHLAFGERLRRMRSVVEARTHLAAAQELFQRLGAVPWAERASQELRATGETRAHLTLLGEKALTPQEHEVAGLAASGLTNKQIGQRLYLSHRTVSAHLYHVFPKLGITSRAALRDALGNVVPS
jgi:DNA-binding CsgD family transcriptional regulator